MDDILGISEGSLLPLHDCSWQEKDVPIAKRGIHFKWLYDFVAKVDNATGDLWKNIRIQYESQKKASIHFENVPWPDSPEYPDYPEANFKTREFVNKIVVPLTNEIKAPLYSRVPYEQRGSPSIFISHTWDSSIVRGGHGSLDMVLDRNRDSYVWIDFMCYNQHLVRDEAIAKDMNAIISSIGETAFVLTTAPFFSRSWCLWEMVCAHRSNVPIYVYDQIDRIKYKYYTSEQSEMPPDFSSITELTATKRADQMEIYELFISTFGSVANADAYIRNILSEHRKKRH